MYVQIVVRSKRETATAVELPDAVCRGIDGVWPSLLGSGVRSQLGLGAASQCGLCHNSQGAHGSQLRARGPGLSSEQGLLWYERPMFNNRGMFLSSHGSPPWSLTDKNKSLN